MLCALLACARLLKLDDEKIGFTLILGAVCLLAVFPSPVNKNQQPAGRGWRPLFQFLSAAGCPLYLEGPTAQCVEFENIFFLSKPKPT